MNTYPLCSIIIPTYNCAQYLCNAIDSALNQSYPNIEVIVVDDGSTDNTKEILQKYQGRIIVLSQENKGVSAARNVGIAISKGEYLVTLDADDRWHYHRLKEVLTFMHSFPNYSAVFTNYHIVNNLYEKICLYDNGNRYIPKNITFNYLLKKTIPFVMLVFKRELINKYGVYDESLKFAGDYELWLRMVRNGALIGYLDSPLAEYMIRDNSITNTYHSDYRKVFKIIFKNQNLSPLKTSYYSTLHYFYIIYYLAKKKLRQIFKSFKRSVR